MPPELPLGGDYHLHYRALPHGAWAAAILHYSSTHAPQYFSNQQARPFASLIATLAATEAAALQQQVETTLLLFDPQEPTEEGGGHRTSKRPRYTNGFVLQGHNVRSMDHVGQVVLLFEKGFPLLQQGHHRQQPALREPALSPPMAAERALAAVAPPP